MGEKINGVLFKFENEGTGYAIRQYYGRELDSGDKLLDQLWATAYDAIGAAEDRIGELTGRIPGDD